MQIKGISLRGLEVFEALARSGSVAQAAQDTGLSQPAVSQQMRNLETALAVKLVDHARRPMRLTPAGKSFLRRATAALSELRLATAEVSVMDLGALDRLSIGIAGDLDTALAPHLSMILSESFEGSRFRLVIDDSTPLMQTLDAGKLDLAIVAGIGGITDDTRQDYALAHEPLIVVAPKDADADAAALLRGGSTLPFLRGSATHQTVQQIDTYLKLQAGNLPSRFEIGSHRALMAMVVRGAGWTVTTPTGYLRVPDCHDGLTALPLPGAGAARDISLIAADTVPAAAAAEIAQAARGLIQRRIIAPAVADLPWLDGVFHLS